MKHYIRDTDNGFRERTCPQCKEKFYCYLATWVYTRNPNARSKLYFCSWKCLRKYDETRQQEVKSKRKKRKENK